MSRLRLPTGEEIRRAAADRAVQALASIKEAQARDWQNQCGFQRRTLRCLLRLLVWAGVHIGFVWLVLGTYTGRNVLALVIMCMIPIGMVVAFINCFGGKKAAKANSDLITSIFGTFWAAECNFFRWAIGLSPQREERENRYPEPEHQEEEEEEEEEDDDAH